MASYNRTAPRQTPPWPQRRPAAFWRSGRLQDGMAYAIIDMGGKQYRVEEGDSVLVDRVGEDEGAKVAPRALLFTDGKNAVLDGPDLGKVKVEAVVAEHLKGPKLRVDTYRPKKRNKRRMGHRSYLSRLEIRKINRPREGGDRVGGGTAAAQEGGNEGRLRWHTRRDWDRAATAATPRRSASA